MRSIHIDPIKKLMKSGETFAQSCKKLKVNRKAFISKLSPEELKELSDISKSPFSLINRRDCKESDVERIEKLYRYGRNVRQICDELQITRSSFYEFFRIEKRLFRNKMSFPNL